jgi:hypothetical protein
MSPNTIHLSTSFFEYVNTHVQNCYRRKGALHLKLFPNAQERAIVLNSKININSLLRFCTIGKAHSESFLTGLPKLFKVLKCSHFSNVKLSRQRPNSRIQTTWTGTTQNPCFVIPNLVEHSGHACSRVRFYGDKYFRFIIIYVGI